MASATVPFQESVAASQQGLAQKSGVPSKPPTVWQPAGPPPVPPGPTQPRVWLHVDRNGNASYVQVEKQTLVQTLGIPYRDLRILDPLVPMPYPTAIFIREKALVINLETVKMIICRDQVFLLSVVDMNQPDKPAKPTMDHHFVTDLCRRLKSPGPLQREAANVNIDTELPYELRALEAALNEVNKVLEHEVYALEQDARSALDNLTKKVSRAALEQVRRIKTRLNRLTARIGKLREELEDLMDDDEDMADMYLGRRAEIEAAEVHREQQMAAMQEAYENFEESGNEAAPPAGSAEGGHQEDFSGGEDYGASNRHPDEHGASYADDADHVHDEHRDYASDPMDRRDADFTVGSDSDTMRGSAEGARPNPTLPATEAGDDLGDKANKPIKLSKAKSKWQKSAKTFAKLSMDNKAKQRSDQFGKLHGSVVSTLQQFHHQHLIDPFRSKPKIAALDANYKLEDTYSAPLPPEPPVIRWSGSAQKVIWGGVDPHDIEGVEALLEAYFMQVDFSMSRLVILKERIDDTEDLINIELDSRRNELVALEVILTTMTLIFSIVAAVGGIFGMNLKSGIEEDAHAFYIVTSLSVAAASGAFLSIIVYCRQKRLMFMGGPSKI